MLTKQFIQNYFHADYKGIDALLSDVLVPMFGDYDRGYTEITLTDTAMTMAKAANIQTIKHVATFQGLGYGINVFDVTLSDRCRIHQARKNIQALVRQYVEKFEGAFIVFHYAKTANRSWRFSYLEKREINAKSTDAKRYTYLCGQQYPCRTLAERFEKLQYQDLTAVNLEAAFSVEALSDEFFAEYKNFYDDFVNFVINENHLLDEFLPLANGDPDKAKKLVRDYIKKLMGRLVFIQFLQNKAWLKEDIHYTHTLFDQCTDSQKESFLENVLEPLFFGIFNTQKEAREELFRREHWSMELLKEWMDFPYLNGGLFECDELDKLHLSIPSYFFSNPQNKDHVRKPSDKYYDDACGIFDFFDRYNFTIDESDPLDNEVGVDPEMLGKIFENLLEDNKDKGAFYTPKEIVNYMCREALVAYLVDEARTKSEVNKQRQENFEDAIRAFVNDPEMTVQRMRQYGKQQLEDLNDSLCNVKICDPAIGSGAFPMGLLNLLMTCRVALNNALGKGEPRAWLKKEIIKNNIYGVDIEKGAIDIARLRFWLSIVVDLEEPEALPNFDYKFMQGNSLLEQYNGVDLSQVAELKKGNTNGYQISMFENELDVCRRKLHDKLEEYFGVTNHVTKQNLRNDISTLVQKELDEQHIEVDLSDIDVSSNDKFFLWHTWFADVFNRSDKHGFDIVIGNPPYLKEGRISKVFFDPYKNSPYYMGKMDIWYIFACHGIDLLHKHGHLCFIATNNWTTNYGASTLREKIMNDTRICSLIDFGSVMIFDSASIQTMIMLFQKDKLTDKYLFDYRKLKTIKATKNDIIALLNKTANNAEIYTPRIIRNNYKGKIFTFSQDDAILQRIEDGCDCFFLNDKEVAQGIVFPQDFLNKKNAQLLNHNVGEGVFVLSNQEKESLNLLDNELSLIKPYFTTEQVGKYWVNPHNNLWTIYTDSHYKNPHSLDNFPNIKNHLDQFQTIMTSDNKPYGLHRAREQHFFTEEKIIAIRKSVETPIFAYCDIECYLSQTFNMIQTDKVNLKYLTGLLNSKIIYYWLKHKGKMQGDNFQLDKEPLLQIPIAIPSIDVQYLVASIVDIIIMLKQNTELVNSYVPNEFIVKQFEKLINGCLFEIYFEDEVKQYGGDSIIATIQKYLPNMIAIQNINEIYSGIESSGIIDTIDSFSICNSNILRTISLS